MLAQIESLGVRHGAHASWDTPVPTWAYAIEDLGPWIFAVLIAALLVRALIQGRRYRALSVFGRTEQGTVHEALMAAEARTTGEIVPVVLERSDSHSSAVWLSAVATLLVGTTLLQNRLPWNAPHLLIGCQCALAAFGFVIARIVPGWKRMFISEARATDVAHEQAAQEFFRLGLHETVGRTGVLLFVSLFERRVVVLGDAGIHAKVGDEHWESTRTAILDGIRSGRMEEGLVDGIRRTGSVLEQRFPWTQGDRNEIPDRVVVRRE